MPDWRAEIAKRFLTLKVDPAREVEITEELSQHLDDRYAALVAGGATEEAARGEVLTELNHGSVDMPEPLDGATQSGLGAPSKARRTLFSSLWQDLRYALRQLQRNPGFALTAIVTLALGMGASTSIFSVIDNVLLEPFPYKDAGRIVFPRVHGATQGQDEGRQGFSTDELLAMAAQNHSLESVIGTADDPVLYKHGDGVEWLYGADMTPGSFPFFGMPALYGRMLQPADYDPAAPPVFVLRYKAWKNRFNGDPNALNKVFVLNGTARTLVGIMPPRFAWYDADLWIPRTPRAGATTGVSGLPERWFVLGKLKPGVSTAKASSDLMSIMSRLAKTRPQDYPSRFEMSVMKMGHSSISRLESTLYIILGAVGLLLLIGCVNVANLLLARATSRGKEFALRAALGASQLRLMRLLLVESLLIAASGAVLGALMAWGGLKLIVAAMPANTIPAEAVIALNPQAMAFTLLLASLTPLLFGLAPALQAARRDLNDPLREMGKGDISSFRSARLRDVAVVVEVAVSLTLLIGAGLLLQSFLALREVKLGLQADHILETALLLPPDHYKTAAQVSALIRPVLTAVEAIPGVRDAAESSSTPPDENVDSKLEVSGKPPDLQWHAQVQTISEGYFRVLRTPFFKGRSFTEAEVNNARRVAIVNRKFASTYFPHQDPIGLRIKLKAFESLTDSLPDPWFQIVGVVEDVVNRGTGGYGSGGVQTPIEAQAWVPYTVTGSGMQVLLIRSAQAPMALKNEVQKAVSAVDPGVALVNPDALEHSLSEGLYAGPRFTLLLMMIFGAAGLILVTIGVYSVLSYTTAQKTHEIGIRMALGAERANVLRLVIAEGLRLVLMGVGVGLVSSVLLARVVKSALWPGVTPYEPFTLVTTVALLLLTGFLACWLPARRAAKVDPMVALRYE